MFGVGSIWMNAETKLKYKFADVNGREYTVLDKFIGVAGMTRKEAVNRLSKVSNSGEAANSIFLDRLEALSLIKFEEEREILGPVAAVKYCRNQYDDTGLMLEKLETDFGYKIVKV